MSTQSQKLVEAVSQAVDAPDNQSVREEDAVEWGWKSPQAVVLAKRHSALVDKKLLKGLSQDEEKELEQINALFDEYDAPFYEPIIERLRALHEQLTQSGQPQSEEK